MISNPIFKKFLSFSIGNWLCILLGIIAVPLTTRLLQTEDFARAAMFILFVSLLTIFINFGTDQSFSRYYYDEDEKHRPKLLLQCLKVPLALFLLSSIIIYLFSDEIADFIFENNDVTSVWLLIPTVFFSTLNGFGFLIIRMEQWGGKYSLLQFVLKFIDLIFIVIFYLLIGAKYQIMIYSYTTSVFLTCLLTVYLGRKLWTNLFRKVSGDLVYSLKDTISYGMPLMFTIALVWLFQSIDQFSIKTWGTLNDLGLYIGAYKIIALLFILKSIFTTYWTPLFLQKYTENPKNVMFFENMYKLLFFIMFSITVLFISAKEIFIGFIGADYRSAVDLLPFLALIPFVGVISEITVVGIELAKKTKWNLFIAVFVCLVNFIGNFLLIPILGAKGAALSTGLSFIFYFILRTHISLMYFKVNYHLKMTYIYMFFLVSYCFYATFFESGMLNLIIGLMLLLSSITYNYKYVLSMYNQQIKLK